MHNDHWSLWTDSRKRLTEPFRLRYFVAVILPMVAAFVVFRRPAFADVSFLIFLGAVVLSAINGGVAPAFVSTAVSALLIRLLFVQPPLSLSYGNDLDGMERMGGFLLVALLLSSLVAALRNERNQLLDSEERYRILAETASDAIIVIDEKGEILYVNPVTEKIFGAHAKELLGRNLTCLLPGNIYQPHLAEMRRHLDTRKKAVAVQLPGLHRSGHHLLVEMTMGSFSRHGKNVFTAVIRDITDYKRAEA